jgi:hypothetical protein
MTEFVGYFPYAFGELRVDGGNTIEGSGSRGGRDFALRAISRISMSDYFGMRLMIPEVYIRDGAPSGSTQPRFTDSGHSEEMVARAIRGRTPKPYVFTKCERVWEKDRNIGACLKAESVRRECEDSLRRLRIEAIDLYQIHCPNLTRISRKAGRSWLAERGR